MYINTFFYFDHLNIFNNIRFCEHTETNYEQMNPFN